MQNSIRKTRINKLYNIANPYPEVTHKGFIAGRIISIRKHGKSIFANIAKNNSESQQIYFKYDTLGEKQFAHFANNFDIGDFIEVKGKKFLTKTKEPTIEVNEFYMLAKALRPLPEKWHGLQNKEERFRKRYLDLLVNKNTQKIFQVRFDTIKQIRKFLDKNKFIEVETPILQPLYGGANAKPFKTHLNALNMDLYLRIAPELYLKRLLIGGFERIYEIGHCFRNEGMDSNHNPEFTMLEFYVAYWGLEQLMDFIEEFMHIFGFPKNWDRIEYSNIVKNGNEKQAYKKLKKPTFVLHLPNIPLAKNGQALQGVISGVELVKAFAEQNSPIQQKQAFQAQEQNDETQPLDKDFIKAMEYGMPPAAGFGMGIDRLIKLLTGAKTLRETILFPFMKNK